MHPLLKIVGRWFLVLVGIVLLIYVGEDLLLRFRVSHNGANAVFDSVTTYEAGAIKGGRQEFYFDQPQQETCVKAMFPHFGDAPCWYARRHTMKLLTKDLSAPRLNAMPPAAGFRARAARSST